jgi:trimethylamine---corrinoid protein Co-methyltransferase
MKTNFTEVLSQDEIIKIDQESMRILEESGVRVLHQGGLELLESIGCKVDMKLSRVYIPSSIVKKAVNSIPEKFSLYGRDTLNKIELGGDNVCFGPGGFAVFAEDLNTGKRRRAIRQDLIDHLKVSDALPGCEFNHVNVFPSDLPIETADLYMWADSLVYQTKPIMSENFSSKSVENLLKMGMVLRGSLEELIQKPNICLDVCILSPLSHDTRQVDLLLTGAKYGLPISIESGPIAGASCPVTLASLLSQSNAEVLSAIVITYAVKPGAKILYGSWGRHLDMRLGNVTMGGPEFAILKVCTAQMGRFYKVPTRGGGSLTDSLISDAQSGYEKMLTTLIPALGGVNYISGMGLNETENLQSLPQLVIDDEIVSMVKKVIKGIVVDYDHLATELIISTGPGGSFLNTDHTNKYFKKEYFYPDISNRDMYENWFAKGAKSVKTMAIEKVKKLISNSPENLLDPKIIKEIYNLIPKGKI